jgi:hypothetical protein
VYNIPGRGVYNDRKSFETGTDWIVIRLLYYYAFYTGFYSETIIALVRASINGFTHRAAQLAVRLINFIFKCALQAYTSHPVATFMMIEFLNFT